ncbi:BPSS1187 family protein [Chitinophaga sp. RAB17]|uniref:BPSS1187 family protein n=1 Tax=Chitinophaga sp. RAB17 TaxID=3233049 RepID=UPI003F8D9F42
MLKESKIVSSNELTHLFSMFVLRTPLLFFAVLLLPLVGRAQVKLQSVSPETTGAGISTVHSPHLAVTPMEKNNRHQLLVMIPGTGGSAVHFRAFDSCFAEMGYYVVTLDYLNNVITTVCSKSEDSTCFDHFRQEIMFGSPVSDKVAVDSVNSLVNRLTKLLQYLAKQDVVWEEFLRHGQPRWDKIIAAGHSQGAGHAAYMGKQFKLRGVLMFSGPQDYLQYFNAPAHWQEVNGRTPVSRYYAFLHVQDPFNYQYQVADVALINHHAVTDTTMVQPQTPVHSTRSILVTDINKSDKHGSTVGMEFIPVWKYMISGATKP